MEVQAQADHLFEQPQECCSNIFQVCVREAQDNSTCAADGSACSLYSLVNHTLGTSQSHIHNQIYDRRSETFKTDRKLDDCVDSDIHSLAKEMHHLVQACSQTHIPTAGYLRMLLCGAFHHVLLWYSGEAFYQPRCLRAIIRLTVANGLIFNPGP